MVLDHLVVQNLNSTEDDVDYDSIITHGAKALYENEKDGKDQKGFAYSSKNVDEMIDQVEKQAVEEAKVLEEKWRLEDEATARGEHQEASREARTFGFAKIWEADEAGLKDVEDQAEEAEMDQDVVDLLLTRKGQIDALEAEEGLARRARQKKLQRDSGVYHEDLGQTPEKKGRGKGKGKGKGKASGNVSSDAEFAPADDIVASDPDGDSVGEAEGLLDDMGRPIMVGGMVQQQHGARPGKKAAKERAKIAARLAEKGDSGPTVPPPAGPSQPVQPAPTPEEKKAKRELKKLHKAQDRAKMMKGLKDSQQAALRSVAQPQSQSNARNDHARRSSALSSGPARILAMTQYHDAQETLQWLYHILREFEMVKELNIWARLALPEVPMPDRQVYYDYLANKADSGLTGMGHAPYFNTPKPREAVMKLIEGGLAAVPGEAVQRRGEAMLDVPTMGPSAARSQVQSRSTGNGETLTVPQNGSHRQTASPLPAPRPQQPAPPATSQPSQPIAAPVAGPSALRPAPARSLRLSCNTSPSVATPRNSTPATIIPAERTSSSSAIAGPAGPSCPVCQKTGHGFSDCSDRPPLEILLEIQASIVANGDIPGRASSPRLSSYKASLMRQEEALDKVNNLIRLYREMQAASIPPPEPSTKRPRSKPSRPSTSNGNGNGTKHDAIVVNDDSDLDEPAARSSQKKARVKHEPESPSRRGRPSHVPYCPICGESRYHIAAACPVVLAGSASIKA